MEKNEIFVMYGNDHSQTIEEMAYGLADAAGLADLIGDRSKRIGLKPNLVNSRPAREGSTTHPEIALGLITYLKKHGFQNIVILEGSWVGESTARAFAACGYTELAKKTGVRLIDTQKDRCKTVDCSGLKIDICESALALDFMINLPVLKGHCQTVLTCALKNNKGIISDSEKRRFHSLGLTKPIAHLNSAVRNDFIVVDGICGDLDFEEGGNPVYGGRLFAARDPVLCDAFAAELMGLDVKDIPYIGLAERLGLGITGPASVRELNKTHHVQPLPSEKKPAERSGKVKRLAAYINEDGACSACYAGLVYALSLLQRNQLERLEKISIGQGFKGKKGAVGVGLCTAAFDETCPGCPPTGAQILKFLEKRVKKG